jgi:hypothetical protein
MVCKKCGKHRSSKNFYKNNKVTCRFCIIEYNKEYQKKYRKDFADKRSEYSKRYREKNKDRITEYYKEWYSANGRKRSSVYMEKITEWQENNPEKRDAAYQVNLEVSRGNIVRPTVCSECGQERKVVGHHDDYTKPLDVRWLCYSCHKIEHNKLK